MEDDTTRVEDDSLMMEDDTTVAEVNLQKKKGKWRLNLFDVIFIACAIAAAALIFIYSNRSAGSVSVLPTGSKETVVYTIEFQGMINGTADLIKPGDSLTDKVENRAMGSVVSVELVPSTTMQKNLITGDRRIVEVPGKTDAIVVVTAQATMTDSQISVDGFAIRVGTRVSINGPLYNSEGFITDIVRGK